MICGSAKYEWKLIEFGPKRNGGFIKITTEVNGERMEICMTDQPGILPNHRKIELCK